MASSAAATASVRRTLEGEQEVKYLTGNGAGTQLNWEPFEDRAARKTIRSSRKTVRPSDEELQDIMVDMEPLETRSSLISRIVSSDEFDFFIGGIITLNAVLIGVEQSYAIDGKDTSTLNALDNGFLVIYIFEVVARIYVFGFKACIQDPWVRFDMLLVIVGVFMNWFLMPFAGDVDGVGFVMILRMTRLVYRLLKLVRTFRLLMRFRELWMLMRGLVNSATTMVYTALTLFLVIFIFGTIGVEIVTKHELSDAELGDPDFAEKVNTHFANLPQTMLTLLQFATLDDMDSVYRPLIDKAPWLFLYFGGAILIISIVLMNLITAVVVNSALEQALQDKELQAMKDRSRKKRLIQELSAMFARIDVDESGEVSKDELLKVGDEDRQVLEQFMTMGDPVEIFETLDVDNTGSLSIQEFCDGIWQVAVNRGSIEVKRTEKKVDSLKTSVAAMQSNMQIMQEKLCASMEELRAMMAQRPVEPLQSHLSTPSKKGFTCTGANSYVPLCTPHLASFTIDVQRKANGTPRSLQETANASCDVGRTEVDLSAVSGVPPEAPNSSPPLPERLTGPAADVCPFMPNGSLEFIARNSEQPCDSASEGELGNIPHLRNAVVSALNEFHGGSILLRKQLEAIDDAMLTYCQLSLPSQYRRLCAKNKSRDGPLSPGRPEATHSVHDNQSWMARTTGSHSGVSLGSPLLRKEPLTYMTPSCKPHDM